MRFLRTIVLVVVTAFALVACSGGDVAEQILEGQEGVGDVEINENNGSVVIEVEDEDGNTAVIGGGEVPDGFPIPVADGGNVAAVFAQGSDATVTLTYPASEYDSLVATYQEFVDSTGGEVNTFTSSDPESVTWTVTTADAGYNISVSKGDPDVSVFLVSSSTG
ncbi:MAG TPA: hypothetical protein VI193_07010 [Acidimicrobiia bacterium]